MFFINNTKNISQDKTQFVYSYDVKKNQLVYPQSHKIKRKLFVKTINNWLNDYNYPLNIDFQNSNEFEDRLESGNERLVKNKYIVDNTINTIIRMIKNKKYKIIDEYQLKEDLCYYLYLLSPEPK